MNFNQNLPKLAGATALQINSDSIQKLKQENTSRSGRSHIVSLGTQLQITRELGENRALDTGCIRNGSGYCPRALETDHCVHP